MTRGYLELRWWAAVRLGLDRVPEHLWDFGQREAVDREMERADTGELAISRWRLYPVPAGPPTYEADVIARTDRAVHRTLVDQPGLVREAMAVMRAQRRAHPGPLVSGAVGSWPPLGGW